MDPLLMEIISWLVILMHHTCLDLLSILRLSYAHNKKSDSSWSRIAERRAWGVLCGVRQPAALARRAGGPIALRPHLSIGLPLRHCYITVPGWCASCPHTLFTSTIPGKLWRRN